MAKVKQRPKAGQRLEGTEAVSVHSKSQNYGEVPLKDEVRKIPVGHLQEIQNPAYIRVEGSITKNLGHYESVRVGVAIEWPCEPTKKSVKQTYEFLSDRVDSLIAEEYGRVMSGDVVADDAQDR